MGPKSRLHQALQAMWGSALVLGAAVALSGCVANEPEVNAANLKWQSISFGQSTDINFATNVLPVMK